MMHSQRKAFTTIELLIVIAVLSILALIAVPRVFGYSKEATATRLFHDATLLQNASQRYYLAHGDWPRASDVPYTAAEVAAFSAKVYDNTGKVITLDPSGSYYDFDPAKIAPHLTLNQSLSNFVLQNPVGAVYVLDAATNARLVTATKPVAIITMTPSTGITTTTPITWSASASYDTNSGGTITQTEWTGNQTTYSTPGTYTASLRVRNDAGIWSDSVSVTFSVLAPVSVVQMDGGSGHSLAVLSDGTMKAWGLNASGQLGNGTTWDGPPQVVPGLLNVRESAAGEGHSLALLQDGTVMAWGNNSSGQLGDGGANSLEMSPIPVLALSGVRHVESFGNHSLALMTDGTVQTWGSNAYGQLGLGDTTDRFVPEPVAGLTNVKQLAAGYHFSLALLNDGTVFAWGENTYGQLGTGDTVDRLLPAPIPGLSGVQAVSAGYGHAVALLTDGTAVAWGFNSSGQLGLGHATEQHSPVVVPGLSNVARIVASTDSTFALLGTGVVQAWGFNLDGELGLGTTDNQWTPTIIPALASVSQIATGHFHAFALLNDGTVMGWGMNDQGQLGTRDPSANEVSPALAELP